MFTVEIEGLDEYQRNVTEGIRDLEKDSRKAVIEASQEAVEEGRRTGTWKDRTGQARATLHSKLVKDSGNVTEAYVIGPLDRHLWLDSGTKPHEILPVRAKYLRFIAKDGALVFTKRVWHPGTKGDGYAGRMWFKAERALRAKLELAADKFVKRFG